MSITVRTRGRLPHWTNPDADYFLTFRAADAISPETLDALRISRYTPDEIRKRVEVALDRCNRGDILRGNAAEVVANSVLFGHERDYILQTWCVMPNHVHLLLRLIEGKCLAYSMQALKSSTAHRINKLLGRSGAVWEREYFDRLIRPGQLVAAKNYILKNPTKANLQNWDWVGSIVAGGALALL